MGLICKPPWIMDDFTCGILAKKLGEKERELMSVNELRSINNRVKLGQTWLGKVTFLHGLIENSIFLIYGNDWTSAVRKNLSIQAFSSSIFSCPADVQHKPVELLYPENTKFGSVAVHEMWKFYGFTSQHILACTKLCSFYSFPPSSLYLL